MLRVGFRNGVRGGFWTDVVKGCRRRVTVGFIGGLNAGFRKTLYRMSGEWRGPSPRLPFLSGVRSEISDSVVSKGKMCRQCGQ